MRDFGPREPSNKKSPTGRFGGASFDYPVQDNSEISKEFWHGQNRSIFVV